MFQFFYLDLALFIFRLALGLVFLLKGLSLLIYKKEKNKILGPKYSWIITFGALLKTFSAILLLFGIWVNIAGIVLSIIIFLALLFHALVWRDKFVDGWDRVLIRFAGALLFALVGGGNWVLIV